MKIACVTTSQIPSSTANSIQVMKVCQALAEVHGTVRLWAPGSPAKVDWPALAGQYGLPEIQGFHLSWVLSRRVFRRYDFILQAFEELRAWKPDVVYTWLPQIAVLAQRRGLPVVLEVHDLPTGRLGPWLFRRFAGGPGRRRLLIITEALRSRLAERYHLALKPPIVQVAPNGVELERYAGLPPAAGARLALGLADLPTAVYAGHFYAGRGMNLLLGLAQQNPGIQFLWVGGREQDVTEWRTRLAELGLQNVILTGFIPNRDLPRYQAAGDFLLMPYERAIAGSSGGNSADICSPMKMFDYLAAGRTIITSDLPVLHEVLNEKNAVFCPPEDLAVWTAALQSLTADPGRCTMLARQAQADAAAYAWVERARRALLDL